MAWLGTWKKRKSITIDHLKIDADLVYFPVAVIVDGDTDFFGELTSDADKLKVAFTKSDEITQLYFECEHFDAANQKAVYHTSKSDWTISSASDTVFYIYFDSSKADNTTYGNTTGNSPATNVWDSNFKGVWHLSESSAPYKDATSNGNDSQSGTYPTQVDGKVGKGQDFERDNSQYIDYGNPTALQITGAICGEALVKLETAGTTKTPIISKWDSLSGNYRGYLMDYAQERFRIIISDNGYFQTAHYSRRLSNNPVSTGIWYHVSWVFKADGSSYPDIYVNGALDNGTADGTTNLTSIFNTPASFKQGRYDNDYADGVLDEIRVSNIARSAAWIKATYHSLFNTLLTWGSLETMISIADSGSGVDTVSVVLSTQISVADSGSGVDTISKLITTLISVSDSGTGVETISTSISLALQDSASGVDSIVLSKQVVLQDSASSIETISKRITYQRLVYDYEDFARPVSLVSYKTSSETLWENKDVVAGEVTDIIDVSTIASLGVYIAVSSATTIKFQVYTADGWKDYDELVFSGAGHIFLNFWTLPFQKIRFQTTQSTTATIEVFYRT